MQQDAMRSATNMQKNANINAAVANPAIDALPEERDETQAVAIANEETVRRWFTIPFSITVTWESAIFAGIMLLAFITRFWDLGTRTLHHDESIHAYYSWILLTRGEYIHNPVYHGPFLYHAVAFMYFLFGATSAVARYAPALFGVIIVGMTWFLRRELGRAGMLLAAFFIAVSPSILYYSRSLRHDIFAAAGTMAIVVGMWRYIESSRRADGFVEPDKRKHGWLYLIAAGMMVGYTDHELTFMTCLIMATFLLAWKGKELISALLRFKLDNLSPASEILLIISTLTLPLCSAVILLLGKFPFFSFILPAATIVPGQGAQVVKAAVDDYRPLSQIETFLVGATFIAFIAIVIAIGTRWRARVWFTAAAIMYVSMLVLYTGLFTNPQGFMTGMVDSLRYWMTQHSYARGGQPPYYFLLLMPLYEFTTLFFALVAMYVFASWRLVRDLAQPVRGIVRGVGAILFVALIGLIVFATFVGAPQLGPVPLPMQVGHILMIVVTAVTAWLAFSKNQFYSFLIYWFGISFALYSWAGEKLPWLMIHIALPCALLAAALLGRIIERVPWRTTLREGGAWLGGSILLLAIMFMGLANRRDISNDALTQQQQALLQGAAIIIVLFLVVLAGVTAALRLGARGSLNVAAISLLLVMTPFTLHTSWQANYLNTDTPVEPLIYVQSAPDVRRVMSIIDELGRRTGLGTNMIVAYDSSVSWPFEWYLKDYPGKRFYGMGQPDPNAEVVLVGLEYTGDAGGPGVAGTHDQYIQQTLGDRYISQQYHLRWNFPEGDYRALKDNPGVILQTFIDPALREKLWRYFIYREMGPLDALDFKMYIRKDIAGGFWSTALASNGTGQQTSGQLPASSNPNPYAAVQRDLSGQVLANQGMGAALRGIAVAPDGSFYVADTRNNRITHYSKDGQQLAQFGKPGTAPGEFNEPWGLAVDKAGNLYVADTWNHRVQKFSPDGKYLQTFGTGAADAKGDVNASPGMFYGPRGVAVDNDGNVYVTDTGNARIQKFDPSGKLLALFGGRGSNPGQFQEPVGIAIDSFGNIYVADTWNHRIQKLDPTGKSIGVWNVQGWTSQSLTEKPYLAVDSVGNVYFTDPEGQHVVELGPDGSPVLSWGKPGAEADSFTLPTGITVDKDGSVLVSDAATGRVIRFQPLASAH